MTAGALLRWDALERRRRGAARGAWAFTLAAGAAAAGAVAWIAHAGGAREALGAWRALVMATGALVVMSGPWRLYWRPETALLARLPIAGGALYALSVARGARAAVHALAIVALAAAPLAPTLDPASGLRLAAVAAGTVVAAALAEPFASTLAGALVASGRTNLVVKQMAGEFGGAPPTFWLSTIPSLVGFAVAALPALGRPLFLAAGVGGAALLAVAGLPLARRTLAASLREVSALDAVKLAHVDLVRARAGEALWSRAMVAHAARPLYAKDVALARRRYPAFYLVTGLLLLGSWATAALAEPSTRARVAAGACAALAAYAVLFARRLGAPPIEQPRLTATLPIAPGTARHAKQAYAIWRALWPAALAAVPAIVRAPAPLPLAALCAGVVVAGALLATVAAGQGNPTSL